MGGSARSSPLAPLALTLALVVSGLASIGAERANPNSVRRCGAPAVAPLAARRADAPPVSAMAAAVIDGDSGAMLFDADARRRLAPASTTKMITAILTLEHGDLDRVVISQTDARAMPESSVMGLYVGAPITVRDLLYGLMLPSGNDAALELARAVAGDERAFVAMMNDKVSELGLADTNFVNPHGLDDAHQYSTAYDLAMIGRYAMRDPDFVAIASTPRYHLPPPFDYDLFNGNSLLGSYPGVEGVKIGWTDAAGWTFVAAATREGHRVLVALMNTQNRNGEAASLFDWTWQSYQWDGPAQPPVWAGARPLSPAPIWNAPRYETPHGESDARDARAPSPLSPQRPGLLLSEIAPTFRSIFTRVRSSRGLLDHRSLAVDTHCDESATPVTAQTSAWFMRARYDRPIWAPIGSRREQATRCHGGRP